MTIESMKQTEFETSTYEQWKEKAEAALKGKPFDAALKTQTIEGIELQPLYTEEMAAGLEKQPVAVQEAKQRAGWKIAQEVETDTAAGFLENIKEELARGSDMVVYASTVPVTWSEEELKQLAELIQQHPIHFSVLKDDPDVLRVFDYVPAEAADRVTGILSTELPVTAPLNVRTVPVNTVPVHQAGGTIVQELGVALSIIAERAEREGFEQLAPKLWVKFAVDTHFFQEIAKLRAFRILWKAMQSAYQKDAASMPVVTETSTRSFSKLDPYVNLLRSGNATFAAVLGGTDVHTTHPHDLLTGRNPVSMRIARNVQLVIREETQVDKVIDPAAGSYFIEKLTAEYVEEAWKYFLRIEEHGGYSEAKKSGWLPDELQTKWKERKQHAATRRTALIGTNVYANPHEAVKDFDIDAGHVEYMAAKRLASPFERLRARGRETEVRTAVVLLEPLKSVKPQADFVTGVLAVAGIEPVVSDHFETANQVNEFLAAEGIDYAVLCGKPESIDAVSAQLGTEAVIDVAGRIPGEFAGSWQQHGIKGAVYSGMHLTTKLEEILNYGKEALEDGQA